MKALIFKSKILLALFLLAGTGLLAQEVKKELHEEYKTNKSTVINIDGKFANLTLNSWDKDQAVFNVMIKVEHPDQSQAQKILDKISVELRKDGDVISVKTNFDEKFNTEGSGKTIKISVDIIGSVPAYAGLDIKTKFGNAELTEFSGPANIDVSFGNMEAESLTGDDINISVSFGELSVGKLGNAEIELSFGSMYVQQAGDIVLDLNQGDFKAGTARNVSAEVKMGSCEIELINPSFESIEIEMKTGDIELGIDKDAGFTLEAEMKMGDIDLPSQLGKVTKGQHGMNSSFSGKYGNGKSSVSLEGKMGNIELKLK